MPNIKKLDAKCQNSSDFSSDNTNTLDFVGLGDSVPYLTNLKIRCLLIPFETFEVFLRQFPQLIKLTISSFITENYSDGFNWERIIKTYLPNLQKFSLLIDEMYFSEDTHIDLDDKIQSFNSLFWHQWSIVIEYYIESINMKRLTLYTLPIQEEYLRTYLHGLEIRRNIDECNANNNELDYKKLDQLDFIFPEKPSSKKLLPKRNYSNLKSFSFSFERPNSILNDIDAILRDFQEVFSISVLSHIEDIYLYDQIYPINFGKYTK